MYEVREISVKLPDDKVLPGFERDVIGCENILTATAATDGTGDDSAAFVSLISEIGNFHFTKATDDETGEVTGIGIRVDGDDAKEALIKGLMFLTRALLEESMEVDD